MIEFSKHKTPESHAGVNSAAPRRRVSLTIWAERQSFLAVLNCDDLAVFYTRRPKEHKFDR